MERAKATRRDATRRARAREIRRILVVLQRNENRERLAYRGARAKMRCEEVGSVSGGSMEKDAIERNRSSLLDFFVFGG